MALSYLLDILATPSKPDLSKSLIHPKDNLFKELLHRHKLGNEISVLSTFPCTVVQEFPSFCLSMH